MMEFNLDQTNELLDALVMGSMVANYPEFVESYGHEVADQKLERMFSRDWDRLKEEVWQATYPAYRAKMYALAAQEDARCGI
tara:strand:+ start:382 stop:627 length:246 start_codon:yes stop_codon:yes gene_type:complete